MQSGHKAQYVPVLSPSHVLNTSVHAHSQAAHSHPALSETYPHSSPSHTYAQNSEAPAPAVISYSDGLRTTLVQLEGALKALSEGRFKGASGGEQANGMVGKLRAAAAPLGLDLRDVQEAVVEHSAMYANCPEVLGGMLKLTFCLDQVKDLLQRKDAQLQDAERRYEELETQFIQYSEQSATLYQQVGGERARVEALVRSWELDEERRTQDFRSTKSKITQQQQNNEQLHRECEMLREQLEHSRAEVDTLAHRFDALSIEHEVSKEQRAEMQKQIQDFQTGAKSMAYSWTKPAATRSPRKHVHGLQEPVALWERLLGDLEKLEPQLAALPPTDAQQINEAVCDAYGHLRSLASMALSQARIAGPKAIPKGKDSSVGPTTRAATASPGAGHTQVPASGSASSPTRVGASDTRHMHRQDHHGIREDSMHQPTHGLSLHHGPHHHKHVNRQHSDARPVNHQMMHDPGMTSNMDPRSDAATGLNPAPGHGVSFGPSTGLGAGAAALHASAPALHHPYHANGHSHHRLTVSDTNPGIPNPSGGAGGAGVAFDPAGPGSVPGPGSGLPASSAYSLGYQASQQRPPASPRVPSPQPTLKRIKHQGYGRQSFALGPGTHPTSNRSSSAPGIARPAQSRENNAQLSFTAQGLMSSGRGPERQMSTGALRGADRAATASDGAHPVDPTERVWQRPPNLNRLA